MILELIVSIVAHSISMCVPISGCSDLCTTCWSLIDTSQTAVFTDLKVNKNGTIASDKSHLRHDGQLFFEESLNDKIAATYPYTANAHERTLNSEDALFSQVSCYRISHMYMRNHICIRK